MSPTEKLNKILSYYGTTKNKLGVQINKRQSLYDINSGKIKSFSAELVSEIIKVYPNINDEWLLYDRGEMLKPSTVSEPSEKYRTNKKADALKQLQKVKNGKGTNVSEGKLLGDSDVINIRTFIIPIKGFSGLKNALFDDMYISDHFEETTTEVPKEYYAHASYKIQSTGQSMTKSIPEGAWVTGVPIPQMDWLNYKFKQSKIYILFHPKRGILFKNVRNMPFGEIKLISENEDKDEYPDETFGIVEFRKILIAIKVEIFI